MSVDKRMEEARKIANGTMPMDVLFENEADMRAAQQWMKGKRKVNNLTPKTHKQAAKEADKRREEIAKAIGIDA